jgi:lipopolysaccharide transport system permease protein
MSRWSRYWDLVVVLTRKEMKIRYKSSVLGYAWSIMNPLAFALVLYVAFQLVVKIDIPDYPAFLICGLFPWQWLSNSLAFAPNVFLRDSQLIKKTSFPKSVLVLAHVLQDMIHFLLALPIMVFFILLAGRLPSWSWIFGVPLLLIVQLLLTFGAALFLASVNLFFRDMERLTATLMILVFYCTPVLYSADMIPASYRVLVYANPFAPIILCWRSLLLHGTMEPLLLLAASLQAAIAFAVGYGAYRRLYWRFAEVL